MGYWIVFALIVFAGTAMMVREGLWSNTITLVNIIISGLVAFGFYGALVVYLNEEVTSGQHTYWLDFAIIWALYCAMMVICRTFTAAASKTRMRFRHPIDPVGGPLVGFIAAWVLACFTLATLHVAPLSKNVLGGNLALSESEMANAPSWSAPDLAWLRFFARMTSKNAIGYAKTDNPDWVNKSVTTWVQAYQNRRAAFEKAPSLIVPRTATVIIAVPQP